MTQSTPPITDPRSADDQATLDAALLAYPFPPGLPARLAREQRWSGPFTLQVLGEYRRFLLLASDTRREGGSVTPSRIVDAAWHAHLEYTRDYWEQLCALTGPLHHTPGDGADPQEQAHYQGQYRQTLERYQARFGHAAPSDVWPQPAPAAPRRKVPWTALTLGVGLYAALLFAGQVAWAWAALIGGALAQVISAWPALDHTGAAQAPRARGEAGDSGGDSGGGDLLLAGAALGGDGGGHCGSHASCGSGCGS